MRKILPLLTALFALVFVSGGLAHAQYSPTIHAEIIPSADLMQPQALKQLLDAKKAPAMFQVGSRLFFSEAHISGSTYAGPGSSEQGLDLLQKAVAHMPKGKLIVLYCGCCPWDRCPNVGPAWKHLHDLGYTNVKVLYLAHNFGDDWVAKGYPTERQ
ncbi:MAG: rhodanese-like domain-containing protein [Acidobacteriota bacterium]